MHINIITIQGKRTTRLRGIDIEELPFSRMRRRKKAKRDAFSLSRVFAMSMVRSSREGRSAAEGIRFVSPWTNSMTATAASRLPVGHGRPAAQATVLLLKCPQTSVWIRDCTVEGWGRGGGVRVPGRSCVLLVSTCSSQRLEQFAKSEPAGIQREWRTMQCQDFSAVTRLDQVHDWERRDSPTCVKCQYEADMWLMKLHSILSSCYSSQSLDNPRAQAREPAFLRRLRDQQAGRDSDRHERQIARPQRLKIAKAEDDDAPTYVDEDTNEVLSVADYKALVVAEGKLEREEAKDEVASASDAAEVLKGETSKLDSTIEAGISQKKRKAARIVADDDADLATADARKPKMKPKKKVKAVTLSFDDTTES
ncbi:hypothetical protein MRB53_041777 [Persea americana]|nr:hypothetical protein MRB53_041777 [Persea americana]